MRFILTLTLLVSSAFAHEPLEVLMAITHYAESSEQLIENAIELAPRADQRRLRQMAEASRRIALTVARDELCQPVTLNGVDVGTPALLADVGGSRIYVCGYDYDIFTAMQNQYMVLHEVAHLSGVAGGAENECEADRLANLVLALNGFQAEQSGYHAVCESL